MAYGGYEYIDFSYEPTKDDFIVLAWTRSRTNLIRAAEALAAESSVGTWTDIKTMNDYVFEKYRARVFKIDKVTDDAGFVYIAYPLEHFDIKNVGQLWASIFGNVFGMKEIEELYYLDIRLPEKYQRLFDGPKFGLEGVRKYIGTDKNRRPHLGTIVKPKVGLAPSEFAEVAYKAWVNGLDLVKDDENLVDQEFCRWQERFDRTFEALDKAEAETGEKKMYLTNITDSDIERMVERLEYVKERGHKQVMLDVYILGWPALRYMINLAKKYNIIVHAHRAGYATWHRGNFGVSFTILSKFYRLIGVDQLHIGTGVGKMEGGALLIRKLHEVVTKHRIEGDDVLGFLDQEFIDIINPIMPVASGGLDPTKIEALMIIHGRDVTIQAGGGVHGHPSGTEAGAKAMRITVEKLMEGWSFMDIVNRYPEVKEAYEKWGYTDPQYYKEVIKVEETEKDILRKLIKLNGITVIKDNLWNL